MFTVIDPCIVAVVPPLPPAKLFYTTDPDFIQTLAPTVTTAYQPYCLFSISLTITKATTPDTSASVHRFTPIVNIYFASATLATVTYIPSPQDLSLVGKYTLTFKYDWGGTGTVTTTNKVVIVDIKDPCIQYMVIQTIANQTKKLLDLPDTTLTVAPTMSTTGYVWCLMDITGTVTKGGSAISDGFVVWTNQT